MSRIITSLSCKKGRHKPYFFLQYISKKQQRGFDKILKGKKVHTRYEVQSKTKVNRTINEFATFSFMFSTTENFAQFLKRFNFKNRKCKTFGSSGKMKNSINDQFFLQTQLESELILNVSPPEKTIVLFFERKLKKLSKQKKKLCPKIFGEKKAESNT